MFKVLLPVLLVGSNAFAQNLCFEAKDASKLTAVISNDVDDNTTTEQLAKASLKLQGQANSASVLVNVETQSGIKATSVAFYQADRDVYQVECDGGNLRVESTTADTVLIASKGFRADSDGCGGTLKISTPSSEYVEFLPVQCAAESSN